VPQVTLETAVQAQAHSLVAVLVVRTDQAAAVQEEVLTLLTIWLLVVVAWVYLDKAQMGLVMV
jgi:hypothetical protein